MNGLEKLENLLQEKLNEYYKIENYLIGDWSLAPIKGTNYLVFFSDEGYYTKAYLLEKGSYTVLERLR